MFRRILAENKNKSLQRIAKLEMVVFHFFTPTWGNSWEMIQIWWEDVLGGLNVIFHFHPHGIHHQLNHHSVGKNAANPSFQLQQNRWNRSTDETALRSWCIPWSLQTKQLWASWWQEMQSLGEFSPQKKHKYLYRDMNIYLGHQDVHSTKYILTENRFLIVTIWNYSDMFGY